MYVLRPFTINVRGWEGGPCSHFIANDPLVVILLRDLSLSSDYGRKATRHNYTSTPKHAAEI